MKESNAVWKGVIAISEFMRAIEDGLITDASGFGYWGKTRKGKKEKTSKQVVPSVVKSGKGPPRWASCVFWYDEENVRMYSEMTF